MKVTFYVPSRTKDGHYLYSTQKDVAEMICGLFSVKFGGATMVDSCGYWINEKKQLIREKTILVYSFFEIEDLAEVIDYFKGLADDFKKALRQESILFTIEKSETYFN